MITDEGGGNNTNKDGVPAAGNLAADLDALKISEEDSGTSCTQHDDTDLFMPPPRRNECPICLLPMPFSYAYPRYMTCCGQTLCNGCLHGQWLTLVKMNEKRSRKDPPLPPLPCLCAFCRTPIASSDEEILDQVERRMKVNDPEAMLSMAQHYEEGSGGIPRDMQKAFQLTLRAAELGSINALHNLACDYGENDSFVGKDEEKQRYYFELAAKGGHERARHNLGILEFNRGRCDVANKHWLISAAAGYDDSLRNIKVGFQNGFVTKDEFADTLRAHQKANDEMRSNERDKERKRIQDGKMAIIIAEVAKQLQRNFRSGSR